MSSIAKMINDPDAVKEIEAARLKTATEETIDIIAEKRLVPELREEVEDERTPAWLAEYTMRIDPRELPSGMKHMRQLSSYILQSEEKSHPVAAMTAAIVTASATTSGLIFSETKLPSSLYLFLVLDTGMGKDVVRTLPKKLSPDSIHAGDYTSVGSFEDALRGNQSYTLIQDEVGDMIAQMRNDTGGTQKAILRVLKTLYSASRGYTTTQYSSQGGKAKVDEAEHLEEVSFGYCGLTTPKQFLDATDESLMHDGFFNRFIVIDGATILPVFNNTPEWRIPPSIDDHIGDVVQRYDSGYTMRLEDDAKRYYALDIGDVDLKGTGLANDVKNGLLTRELAARVKENTIRLGMAIAGYELMDEIPKWLIQWSHEFVRLSAMNFVELFNKKDEETQFSRDCDDAIRWFKKDGKKWVLKSHISRHLPNRRRLAKEGREKVLSELLDMGEIETMQESNKKLYRLAQS